MVHSIGRLCPRPAVEVNIAQHSWSDAVLSWAATPPRSALSELQVAAVARVVRAPEDVEQTRAHRDEQAAGTALGRAGERRPPGGPALRGRGLDPALGLVHWGVRALECPRLAGHAAEPLERRQQSQRIQFRLHRWVDPERVRAGGLEGGRVGEPLAKLVQSPVEEDADLDCSRTHQTSTGTLAPTWTTAHGRDGGI